MIPLTHDRRVHFLEDGPVLQLFKRLEWMDPQKQWEQFQAPCAGQGASGIGILCLSFNRSSCNSLQCRDTSSELSPATLLNQR